MFDSCRKDIGNTTVSVLLKKVSAQFRCATLELCNFDAKQSNLCCFDGFCTNLCCAIADGILSGTPRVQNRGPLGGVLS